MAVIASENDEPTLPSNATSENWSSQPQKLHSPYVYIYKVHPQKLKKYAKTISFTQLPQPHKGRDFPPVNENQILDRGKQGHSDDKPATEKVNVETQVHAEKSTPTDQRSQPKALRSSSPPRGVGTPLPLL